MAIAQIIGSYFLYGSEKDVNWPIFNYEYYKESGS